MNRMTELSERKTAIALEAARRFEASKRTSAPKGITRGIIATPTTPAQDTRIHNYIIRESERVATGLDGQTTLLKRLEGVTGNTVDFEKFAPHEVARRAGMPVARIHENVNGRIPEGFGTGFLVSPQLLLTNHHVFPQREYAVNCVANFNYEYDKQGLNPGTTFRLNPEEFFYSDKDLDFALVFVETESIDRAAFTKTLSFIRMIETPGKILKGQPVNIIQYPLGQYKRYAYRNNKLTNIIDPPGYFLQYETDTLQGSSGSPIFNEHWELVGLHHSAIPDIKNGRIMNRYGEEWNREDEADVRWIANEGISISAIVAHLKKAKPHNARYIEALLTNVSDPLFETRPVPGSATPGILNTTNAPNMTNYIFNFTGTPVVNIYNGVSTGIPVTEVTPQLNGAKQNGSAITTTVAEEKNIRFDENYSNRRYKGYKENFLRGYEIALPTVKPERADEIYELANKGSEIKYYHYSLAMNAVRRLAMWTAVNVDYNKRIDGLTREVLGKDKWRTDPRIPEEYQITAKQLYDPARNFDQGHLVRREDAAWGEEQIDIEYANADTFHFTNCTPQHEAFNQAHAQGYTIEGVWGALEEHIKRQLKFVDNKASIFAGPVLKKRDPSEDFGSGKIQYPLKFWKVLIVDTEEYGLVAYGFVLDQSEVINEFGLDIRFERMPDFTKFKKYQVKLPRISTLAGVTFDDQLLERDVLANHFDEADKLGIEFKEFSELQLNPKEQATI